MQVTRIMMALVFGYCILLAYLYFAQTAIIFPGASGQSSNRTLPPGAEPLTLETNDGITLVGLRLPAADSHLTAPLIMGFGGNAWDAISTARLLTSIFPGHEIVSYHYRGYGPSGGSVSAAALLKDSLAIYDSVRRASPKVDILPVGMSVGTGPAVHVARHRDVTGMLLITPFDSLQLVAEDQLWWAPVGLLFRQHMRPIEDILEIQNPVAIIRASNDNLIPAARTAALSAATPNLVYSQTIEGADHNDIYNRPELREAMRAALLEITRRDQVE